MDAVSLQIQGNEELFSLKKQARLSGPHGNVVRVISCEGSGWLPCRSTEASSLSCSKIATAVCVLRPS